MDSSPSTPTRRTRACRPRSRTRTRRRSPSRTTTKLVALLGQAFDGTAQPGSTLPLVYGEFGIETQIPQAKTGFYTGTEPATTKPVDEPTQGTYYRDAIALSFCQPNVRAILLLPRGRRVRARSLAIRAYYADGTPKASLPAVRDAARAVVGGTIARCPGLLLTPQATVAYPRGAALTKVPLTVRLRCDVDCNYYLRLEKLPRHSTTLAVTGKATAGTRLS